MEVVDVDMQDAGEGDMGEAIDMMGLAPLSPDAESTSNDGREVEKGLVSVQQKPAHQISTATMSPQYLQLWYRSLQGIPLGKWRPARRS